MTGSDAASISIGQTLALLDGPLAAVVAGVCEDRYAFWLGSGISFGRVEGLPRVVSRVLEFLRRQIDPAAADCKFKATLTRALGLATLSAEERARVDLSRPFPEWPDASVICSRLTNNYARFLDLAVEGEEADYLLWNGVDVRTTFANPATQPDVEHLCVAILMLEGVASDVATANWDGLIERAVDELNGGQPAITVCVRQEDFRQPTRRASLYKFHGCAVRAAADETVYRALLIARQSQINGWAAQPERAVFVNRLIDLIASKPTLMMGLSAQDANIQALFAKAEAMMAWPWPGDRPSYVFSEDQVGIDQEGLLRNVYRSAFTAASRQKILQSSLVRAYAKPLLVALTLHVLFSKIRRLAELAPGSLNAADRLSLQGGITAIRDAIAATADADRLAFVRLVVACGHRSICLLRDGRDGNPPRAYMPVTTGPLHQLADEPGLPASGLREASVALGLLGIGVRDGLWTLTPSDVATPNSGTAQIKTSTGVAKLLLTANSQTALHLQQDGNLASHEDAIVIYSAEISPAMTRSPRGALGRTGKLGLREVSITRLLNETSTLSELLQRLREAIVA